jgi:hypothetical protein
MDLAVMSPTQGHGEFITDLAPERPALREPQMVGSEGRRPQIRQGCLATYLT